MCTGLARGMACVAVLAVAGCSLLAPLDVTWGNPSQRYEFGVLAGTVSLRADPLVLQEQWDLQAGHFPGTAAVRLPGNSVSSLPAGFRVVARKPLEGDRMTEVVIRGKRRAYEIAFFGPEDFGEISASLTKAAVEERMLRLWDLPSTRFWREFPSVYDAVVHALSLLPERLSRFGLASGAPAARKAAALLAIKRNVLPGPMSQVTRLVRFEAPRVKGVYSEAQYGGRSSWETECVLFDRATGDVVGDFRMVLSSGDDVEERDLLVKTIVANWRLEEVRNHE